MWGTFPSAIISRITPLARLYFWITAIFGLPKASAGHGLCRRRLCLQSLAQIASLPRARSCSLPTIDNFWPMGDTGPCGPCSSLLTTMATIFPVALLWECRMPGRTGSSRVWNLCSCSTSRSPGKARRPARCRPSDTGMGLDCWPRAPRQGTTIYDIDRFRALITASADARTLARWFACCSHSRQRATILATSFLIARCRSLPVQRRSALCGCSASGAAIRPRPSSWG